MEQDRDGLDATMEVLGATAPAEPVALPEVGAERIGVGTQIGRLVVLGPLGEGGTAFVYLAYDRELDRKVALKFMRPSLVKSERATQARTRLLREAQALARLNHPNVVAVHDVGTYNDVVFIAESFVDGWTVAEWVKERPRTVREILDVFIQAGRALEAAHAAGLVHRDFKPDNVLVGRDGRVQVTDFGLARAVGDTQPEEPVRTAGATVVDSIGVLSSPLTRTGTVMGTPAYMAPEQHLCQRTDPRTDQFNFCVSLYETLYGERPFAGETIGELAREVTQGRVRPAPKGSKVPAWLRAVLLKGLRAAPEERYPSMRELLEALSRDPDATRRRVAVAIALVALVGAVAAGVVAYSARGERVCGGGERRLAGVWDDGRREAVRRAFLGTGKPYAESAWKGVAAAIDAHAAAWTAMRREACVATRLRGEQSEALLDLRMQCLERQLGELRMLVDVLEKADGDMVERGTKSVAALGDLSLCADAEGLRSVIPPPKDAATRARVETARATVAKAKALEAAGRYKEALAVALEAVRESQTLGYKPLVAEALYQAGVAKSDTGDISGAERTLEEALVAAVEGHHREVAASAAILLTHHVGYSQRRAERGHFWASYGKAVLATLGKNDPLEARWHNAIAGVYYTEGKYDKQLVHNQRALFLRQRAYGPVHPAVASSLNNLGVTYSALGNPQQSAEYFARAKEIFETISGPDHPDVALALMNLSSVHGSLGEFAKQRAEAERAVAIFGKVVGEHHPHTAMAVAGLAAALHNQDDHQAALAQFRRALVAYEKTEGPRHPNTASAVEGVGRELRCLGGHAKEALAHARRAVEIVEGALGKEHPELASPLSFLGLAQIDAGAPAEAVGTLERALVLRRKASALPEDMAETEFGLARALWESGRDKTRAIVLAEAARDKLRRVPHRKRELLQASLWVGQRKKPAAADGHGHSDGHGHGH